MIMCLLATAGQLKNQKSKILSREATSQKDYNRGAQKNSEVGQQKKRQ